MSTRDAKDTFSLLINTARVEPVAKPERLFACGARNADWFKLGLRHFEITAERIGKLHLPGRLAFCFEDFR